MFRNFRQHRVAEELDLAVVPQSLLYAIEEYRHIDAVETVVQQARDAFEGALERVATPLNRSPTSYPPPSTALPFSNRARRPPNA